MSNTRHAQRQSLHRQRGQRGEKIRPGVQRVRRSHHRIHSTSHMHGREQRQHQATLRLIRLRNPPDRPQKRLRVHIVHRARGAHSQRHHGPAREILRIEQL